MNVLDHLVNWLERKAKQRFSLWGISLGNNVELAYITGSQSRASKDLISLLGGMCPGKLTV